MDLNKLRNQVYTMACKHRFHNEEHNNEHWLMLVITELAEAVEADRKGLYITAPIKEEYIRYQFYEFHPPIFDLYIKETVDAELADAFIRLLDLAGLKGMDLESDYIFISDLGPDFISSMYNICKGLTYSVYSLSGRVRHAIESIVLLCQKMKIDLEWVTEEKMKYNSMREYKHGKKY